MSKSKGQFSLFFILVLAVAFLLLLALSTIVAQKIGFEIKHRVQVVVKAADIGKEIPTLLSVRTPYTGYMEALGNTVSLNRKVYQGELIPEEFLSLFEDIGGKYLHVSYRNKNITVFGEPIEAYKTEIPVPGAREEPRAVLSVG